MILITHDDPSGAKRFFAGFYADNTVCFTVHEQVALNKSLGELRAIVKLCGLNTYTIRESISANPVFSIPRASR